MEEIRKTEKVPRDLQIAFKRLATELIFQENFDLNISNENKYRVINKIISKFMLNYLDVERKEKNDGDPNKLTYSHVGFTPALSLELDNGALGLNCVGRAIFTGAIQEVYSRLGFSKVYMALGANHPEIIIKRKDEWTLVNLGDDGDLRYTSLTPEVEEYQEVKIFRFDEFKLDNKSKLFLVFNYRNAVLYEILENFAYLRSVCLEETESFLPGSKEHVLDICKKYKKIIVAGDWKKLQEILFPTITSVFRIMDEEMGEEILRVRSTEVEDSRMIVYENARFNAENEIYERTKNINYLDIIRFKLKANKEQVIDFMEGGSFKAKDPRDKLLSTFLNAFRKEIMEMEEDYPGSLEYAINRLKRRLSVKTEME